MTTIAVVPAFNEAGRVGPTVASLSGLPMVTDVVVIDDGSTDDTAAEARAAGACCLSLPRNVGKGDALNAGVALVRHRIVDGLVGVPDVLLLADADLAETAGELLRLIEALDEERVDMAIADLPAQGSTGFGLAKALAASGLRRFTGLNLNEPLSGQRAVRWRALPAVVPFAPNFGVEVAMTLKASDAGLNIVEVEVPLKQYYRCTVSKELPVPPHGLGVLPQWVCNVKSQLPPSKNLLIMYPLSRERQPDSKEAF